MKVRTLHVENLRSIASATFHFLPDLNVIAGVNGVGKSTILRALARCVSRSVRLPGRDPITRTRAGYSHAERFGTADIRKPSKTMTMTCAVSGLRDDIVRYRAHHVRGEDGVSEEVSPIHGSKAVGSESPGKSFPLIVLFGTRRAIPSKQRPVRGDASGGPVAAMSRAVRDRAVSVVELGVWFRAMHSIRREAPAAEKTMAALQHAVSRMLPGYGELRVPAGQKANLVIDRDGTRLPVASLSDGERACLAIVADLTRRLALANPSLENPAREAEAVVLIDEVELHLHPGWQRRILKRLVDTFPGCQFIVTTHSPQVIGEVKGGHIHLMTEEGVFSPPQSYGLDSNRVLEEVMEVGARTESVKKRLDEAAERIDREDYDAARESVEKLRRMLGENDADVVRLGGLLEFLGEGP